MTERTEKTIAAVLACLIIGVTACTCCVILAGGRCEVIERQRDEFRDRCREMREKYVELTEERNFLLKANEKCRLDCDILNRVIDKLYVEMEGKCGLSGYGVGPDGEISIGHNEPPCGGLRLELTDSRAECRATAEEFAKALDRIDKLESLIEAKDAAIRERDGTINCLREELEKRKDWVPRHVHFEPRRHK